MSDIEIGAKVELLPGRDEVYRYAVSGSRGIVTKQKIDDYGFPMIYIEWDKDHWRFNGEPDGWTFASHFQVIEDPEPEEEFDYEFEDLGDLLEDITSAHGSKLGDVCPHCGGIHTEEQEKYIDAMMSAFDEAADSEGFILLTIKRSSGLPGTIMYVPEVFQAAVTETARKALDELRRLKDM